MSLIPCKPIGSVRIGLVGFGRSNAGVFETLRARGYQHFKIREKNAKNVPPCIKADVVTGDGYLAATDEDVLFLSPSVRADRREFSDFLARGGVISSDARLFFDEVAGDVFAVTGSDGKSTTVTLAHKFLETAFPDAGLGGNIGAALSPFLRDDAPGRKYAVELSSFQLLGLSPRTKRAVVTTVTANHLDYHKSMDEYVAAKANVYKNTDGAVVNFDDPVCRRMVTGAPFAVFSVGADDNALRATGAELFYSYRDGQIFRCGVPILSGRDIALPGEYAVKNVMAALCLTDGYADPAMIREVTRTFSGLPHRMQTVADVRGVLFVDSSIDSSPARTVTTLLSATAPAIVLLGGRGKGVPFDALVPALAKKARGVVLLGETAGDIAALIEKNKTLFPSSFFTLFAGDMKEAVTLAAGRAKPGDWVLLSPAATSFDAYRDFEARGDDFLREVKNL